MPFIYLLKLAGGFISLLIHRLTPSWGYLIFGLLILSGLALLMLFEKLPYEHQQLQ